MAECAVCEEGFVPAADAGSWYVAWSIFPHYLDHLTLVSALTAMRAKKGRGLSLELHASHVRSAPDSQDTIQHGMRPHCFVHEISL
jgi:hypothetical protein